MKTPKLKPCPFCGGEAELISTSELTIFDNEFCVRCKNCYGSTFDNKFCVRCKNCYGSTEWYIKKDKAVAAWNRRDGNNC